MVKDLATITLAMKGVMGLMMLGVAMYVFLTKRCYRDYRQSLYQTQDMNLQMGLHKKAKMFLYITYAQVTIAAAYAAVYFVPAWHDYIVNLIMTSQ